MKLTLTVALAATALAGAAHAAGDVEAGEKIFKTKCRSCHSIVSPDGETIQKGGRTGPNLFGVIGREAGHEEGFRYKDSVIAAGEKGLFWDEVTFEKYVQDPTGFLKEFLGDDGARSGMTFKLNKGMEDIYAYLVSVSPAPEAAEGAAEEPASN